jgi:hypothetical protein
MPHQQHRPEEGWKVWASAPSFSKLNYEIIGEYSMLIHFVMGKRWKKWMNMYDQSILGCSLTLSLQFEEEKDGTMIYSESIRIHKGSFWVGIRF